MSEIVVAQPHALVPSEAKARVEEFASFVEKYGIRVSWQGSEATLKGPGIRGVVVVGSAEVVITVKIGLLARTAGVDPERLRGALTRRLGAAFDAAPSETP